MFDKIHQRYQQQTTTPQRRYDNALKKVAQHQKLFVRPPQPEIVAQYTPNKRLSGIIISSKDTFDLKGERTQAGSSLPFSPAKANADCIDKLLNAGAILFGRTNMSEFAFSGLGLNPHYGTPTNFIDPERIAGGSTSGGAITVASGLCDATLGTDTGGSLRIPAAFNGLVGFKPSRDSVNTRGCFPLSPSLDCIGPITRCVDDAIKMWRCLTDNKQAVNNIDNIKLVSVQNIVFEQADTEVLAGFTQAISQLKKAGVSVREQTFASLDEVFAINSQGGLVLPESAWVHEKLLKQYEDLYDPLIAARIRSGAQTALIDYIDRMQQRPKLQSAYEQALGNDSLLICPTVAILPPTIRDVSRSAEAFAYYNKLALRNTSLFNFLDVPSISIPFYSDHGVLPIGIMLCGKRGGDTNLLAAALTIEQILTHQA